MHLRDMRLKPLNFDKMITNINSLVEFIKLIQKRTPMYLGGRTIIHLKAFLDGWFFGKGDEIKDGYLLGDFQDWIQKKYKVKSTQSWARIILFYSTDEFSALSNFFELFNEFLKAREQA